MRLLDLSNAVVGQTIDTVLPQGRLLDLIEGETQQGDDEILLNEKFSLRISTRPVRHLGRQIGYVVTLRDRTEHVGLLRELDGVTNLTNALRAQQHEYANRMHALNGLLELGRYDEAREYLGEISTMDADLAERMEKEFRNLLQERLNMVKQTPLPYLYQKLDEQWQALRRSIPSDFDSSPETGVSLEKLHKIGAALTQMPEGFKPVKQIEKLLKEREEMLFQSGKINWALAELLAYGSILCENKVVRISGQDVQRGTFSHRHAVIRDSVTNHPYNSLNHITENQEQFLIFNSLLSEYAVLGFEFGYSMANPHALTIWEAQFGDFANGAQVMIDQFITSTESKWNRMNSLVMLLPHGYEGQGPEHSNARPERFLQLAAEYNIVVANISSPANFFHALRRQLAWEFRKPLIIMSPKSLLRHPKVVSTIDEITSGSFQEIYEDKSVNPKQVKRVLLCSGKIYFDLLERQQNENVKDVAIIRIEQLHPFPQKRLHEILKAYKNPSLLWVQEEPENMGAWGFILRQMRTEKIDVIARKESASPAVGYQKVHMKQQEEIISAAFQF
jgi:2-oxoglutarate dehydrogenase E1 component